MAAVHSMTLLLVGAKVFGMALRRALEMLRTGERINDQLYRSTTEHRPRPLGRRWTSRPGNPWQTPGALPFLRHRLALQRRPGR